MARTKKSNTRVVAAPTEVKAFDGPVVLGQVPQRVFRSNAEFEEWKRDRISGIVKGRFLVEKLRLKYASRVRRRSRLTLGQKEEKLVEEM